MTWATVFQVESAHDRSGVLAELAHRSDLPHREEHHIFVGTSGVSSRPAVDLADSCCLLRTVRMLKSDRAVEHDAPVRTRATVAGQSLKDRREVGSGGYLRVADRHVLGTRERSS